MTEPAQLITEMGRKARAAFSQLTGVSDAQKSAALTAAARHLRDDQNLILAANQRDMASARERDLSDSMLDRLMIDAERLEAIAAAVEHVGKLPDPVGQVIDRTERPLRPARRIENDEIAWLDWPETEHCVSALADIRGTLWAGSRNGILFERKNDEFQRLDVPSAEGSVNRLLSLTDELTLILGDNGLLGVTDGDSFCAAPRQYTGAEANFTGVFRVGDELLVTSSEADHVKNVLVFEL